MNKRKALITGEHGNLGTLLVRAFRKQGYEIVNDSYKNFALHNKRKIPGVFLAKYKNELEIRDIKLFEQIISEKKPDVLVHTAAYVGTDKCDKDKENAKRVNVNAVTSLIDILKKQSSDTLFVNFSTTATMDPNQYSIDKPITESTPRNPQTWYGQTKLMGEQEVKKYSKWINFVPVFLFNVFPQDNSSIWPKIFKNTLIGKSADILLDPEIYKQYEFSENLIKVIFKIIENPDSICKDIVLCGPEKKKLKDFLFEADDEFKGIYGKNIKYNLFPEKDYLKNHVADNSLMFKLSGVSEKSFMKKRKSFREAIREVARSCR